MTHVKLANQLFSSFVLDLRKKGFCHPRWSPALLPHWLVLLLLKPKRGLPWEEMKQTDNQLIIVSSKSNCWTEITRWFLSTSSLWIMCLVFRMLARGSLVPSHAGPVGCCTVQIVLRTTSSTHSSISASWTPLNLWWAVMKLSSMQLSNSAGISHYFVCF